ncbi:MAG: hypothetical protein WD397_02195 [Wenzhouxiangellaceae bacterium]
MDIEELLGRKMSAHDQKRYYLLMREFFDETNTLCDPMRHDVGRQSPALVNGS